MTVRFQGVRGRVTITVLVVATVLYSVLATLGFLQVVASGRAAIETRVDEVLDQLERQLETGTGAVRITAADGVTAEVVPGTVEVADQPGQLVVTRALDLDGFAATMVGRASVRGLNDSLRSLNVALWVAVPLAALFTAMVAGAATARALRPVDDITRLASRIGADASERVPVPQTSDEIERLATTVNGMLDRIADGRRAAKQFTSDAAHELRTPLMALQGEIELMQRGVGDNQSISRLQMLSGRLGDLVDDLVLLSTLDEGRPIAPQNVGLVELAQREAETALPDLKVDGVDVTAALDPLLVGRAIRNLVANARRHAASEVAVTIQPGDRKSWIHVDDDGPGVDPADAELAFERFGRLDQTRSTDSGGTGLGLAIVAAVARSHGGNIEVTTSPLGGARFSMWIPHTIDGSPGEEGGPVTGVER